MGFFVIIGYIGIYAISTIGNNKITFPKTAIQKSDSQITKIHFPNNKNRKIQKNEK